jgi:ParB-like chromosome segregation protein Spo0J
MNKGLIRQIEIEIETICNRLKDIDTDTKIEAINILRENIHNISPFKSEPVDFVRWIKNNEVQANDYNPNTVAPPEMELLRHSIAHDGYTQPIVGWKQNIGYEVIDGFHRHRVGKECSEIQSRVHGYLPIVQIQEDNEGQNDRVASTIRHNRARGKHRVEAMADIVLDLKKRNWSDKKISKELGMDQDEVLRLSQITGLMEAFADTEFSEAWEIKEDD